MFDITDTARTIANEWPALVGTLPKSLTDAIAVYDEAGYAEGPYVGIDASKITTKNAQQVIADLAESLAAEDKFNEAKRRVLRVLARNIVSAAEASVPWAIEKIRPEFDRAVTDYSEAVQALPDDINSAALVDAGPGVLDAYQRATAAAVLIAKVDAWLANLVHLPAYAGRDVEPALRVLNPAGRRELRILVDATDKLNPDTYLQRLSPLYLAAVREGIEFEMHTPAEASELRQRIEATPVERRHSAFVKF